MSKRKWFGIGVLILFITASTAWAAEDFPPPAADRGTIGNARTGADWLWGYFEKLKLNDIEYIFPSDNGDAGEQLTTDGAGNLTWEAAGGGVTMDVVGDPAADVTLVYDDNETAVYTFADTNEDMFNIQGLGAFGDVSVVRIEQKTGNPTDGTVLEVVAADDNVDPLVISASNKANALVVGQNTGVVTIAGVAEGTTALSITAGDINLVDGDLNVPGGDATFGEDVTITGNLIGGTGLINYTNFDVDASGNLSAVNGTFTGNLAVTGAFTIDAVVAKTAATTITLDGTGVGGVTVGGTSTGTITLGGGATLVNLPSTVDLVLAGGDLTITDTANADMVTFTNNTMTTADLLVLSAAGTRTSDNVIEITDGATTGTTIGITANAMTSGDGISFTSSGAVLTGSAFAAYITDGAGFTGYYFRGYDGAADDFSVKRYGATTIAGNAATNVLTVTAGDVQIDAGRIEIDNTGDVVNRIARNNATGTGAVLEIEQTHTGGGIALLVDQKNTTAGEYAIDITSGGATQIHFTANGAAGSGMLYDVTNAWTGQALVIDAGPWLGTLNRGVIDFRSDAAATAEVGHVMYVKMQGTGADAAAIDGKGLYIEDEGAATAGSYLVKLDSLANTALHISNAGAAADGIKIDVANSYTGQGFVADLGPWLGTAGEGFISLFSDNAATVPAGQFMRFRQLGTGQHAAAIAGSLIFLEDDATAPAAGTSYALYIDATNIEAIHVDTGKVLVDETVTATGGVSAGNAADSLLKIDTVELTAANIKDLKDTKITLVAAPGADYFVEIKSISFILDAGATPFDPEAADDIVVEYETSGSDIVTVETAAWLASAADAIAFVVPTTNANVAASSCVNKAVLLFNADATDIANGDGTVTVKVSYMIHKAGL